MTGDDCFCVPLRWQEIDWAPWPGLLSTLGGEQMVCAVPHCGCGTPPATTRCGRTSNPLGRRELKDSAVGLGASVHLVAAVCVLCAWLYLAVRRGWRRFCVRCAAGFASPCLCSVVYGKVVGGEMCAGE
ncbi:putative dispersed gene family protein 1 (DGF-1) [Trypanosoma cruzi]|nr:putative dispersed gene family protein 1 (DGF-1) [Trypanosoma cruzi]